MMNSQIDEVQISASLPTKAMDSPVPIINRLRRLLILRYQAAHYLDDDDIHLLDRCVYASYCDCIELGAEDQARQLLERARASQTQAAAR